MEIKQLVEEISKELTPMAGIILVKRIKVEKSKDGMVLPIENRTTGMLELSEKLDASVAIKAGYAEWPHQGIICAVGGDEILTTGLQKMEVEPGDMVIIGTGRYDAIVYKGEEILVMRKHNIHAKKNINILKQ